MQLIKLSASRCETFQRCAREHHYRYVLRLRPTTKSRSLALGSAVDAAIGALQLGKPFSEAMSALYQSAKRDALDDFDLARAQAMLCGYVARWSKDDASLNFVGTQVSFSRPLLSPHTYRPVAGYEVVGVLDGVAVRDGKGFIIETKTTSSDITPGSDYWIGKRVDFQASVYWSVAGYVLDVPMAGIVYNVLRKPSLQPGKATPVEQRQFTLGKGCKECGGKAKLAGSGCDACSQTGWSDAPRLYKGQREQDETYDEFFARCVETISENYDAHYQRGTVVRMPDEEHEHLTDLYQLAMLMRVSVQRNYAPKNPHACVRYGRRCEYLSLCTQEADVAGMVDRGLMTIKLPTKEDTDNGNS